MSPQHGVIVKMEMKWTLLSKAKIRVATFLFGAGIEDLAVRVVRRLPARIRLDGGRWRRETIYHDGGAEWNG